MERDTIRLWALLAAVIVVFVASCLGPGYLAGAWVRRRAWPWTVCVLMCAAIALIWPALIIGMAFDGAANYQPLGPDDVRDAPGMGIVFSMVVAPFLFALSLSLAIGGARLAWKRDCMGTKSKPDALEI